MSKTTFFIIALCVPLLSVVVQFGNMVYASDTFTVTQSISTADAIPPTIPGNFSVTPITSSQIDLNWDASSDNISVAGYQVFRDSAQIATTTATSFTDTSLTASTTYAYNVVAFDVLLNFSTSTAVLATTTFPLPATSTVATSTGTNGYQLAPMEIENLQVATSEDSIVITFDSSRIARSVIRWGQSSSYEVGFTGNDVFQKQHGTIIDGLSPGTAYQIEIIVFDRFGVVGEQYQTVITTDSRPDDQPPQNVANFQAEVIDREVLLSWSNPDINDFSKVRILSSDSFYPAHIADGWLVYDGMSTTARDPRELQQGDVRYYSIFVYDEAGNVSSGAVMAVARPTATGNLPTTALDDPVASTSIQDTLLARLSFTDVRFVQNDQKKEVAGNRVELSGAEQTIISIPYTALPEHLKTIVVTVTDPGDADLTFSFLLRINQDATEYAAHIGPLLQPGVFPVAVSVFDFKTQQLVQVTGEAVVDFDDTYQETVFERVSDGVSTAAAPLRALAMGSLVLLLILLFWRRRLEAEDKHL